MKFSPRIYPGRLASMIDALPAEPGVFLDVGNLGDGGPYAAQMRALIEKRGGTYAGLDSNANLTTSMNLPNQKVGDLHAAPFADGTFDTIYLGELIEHTWDPRQMIRECYRMLKPRGVLIIDTPNVYSLHTLLRLFFKREDSMGDNRALTLLEAQDAYATAASKGEKLLQPQHKIFFTPAMLGQLLNTQGFVVQQWSVTAKAHWLLRAVIHLFPVTGQHLCCKAVKATIKEAFADVTQTT